jgi:Predicted membrane protein (DUF2142)
LQPWAISLGWTAIVWAGVAAMLQDRGPSLRLALGTWAILLIVAGGIALALYITWTPVGGDRVLGMQGRYFIPLLCAVGLGLPAFAQWLDGPVAKVLPVALPRYRNGLRLLLTTLACVEMTYVLAHGVAMVRRAYLGV